MRYDQNVFRALSFSSRMAAQLKSMTQFHEVRRLTSPAVVPGCIVLEPHDRLVDTRKWFDYVNTNSRLYRLTWLHLTVFYTWLTADQHLYEQETISLKLTNGFSFIYSRKTVCMWRLWQSVYSISDSTSTSRHCACSWASFRLFPFVFRALLSFDIGYSFSV